MSDFLARLLCALVAGLIFSCCTSAQERRVVPEFRTYGKPATTSDAAAIDALIRQYKKSWGQQDVDGLMALHAEDVEWINAYARMFQGADPLAEFLAKRLFPAFDSSVSAAEIAHMRMISIRYLAGDAAVVHMYTDGPRGASRNENEALRRTHMHLVLEKRNARWTIVHTAIMDAR